MKNSFKDIKRKGHRRRHFLAMSACIFIVFASFSFQLAISGCNIYRFKDVSIPDTIKTVKVDFIENRAQYINPQLSPRLTDKLRQKIIGQTRLTQINDESNVDWQISGYVNQYVFSTSAISDQQVTTNRLTVGVHVILNDKRADRTQNFDVSRSFEFSGNQSFQQAESTLGEEIVRSLTDDIFNKLFSNW